MKLVSFTVENYRSITNARRVRLEDYTVLLGPNNEGKSNILNALNLGMEAIRIFRPTTILRPDSTQIEIPASHARAMESYDWKRDFPINLQEEFHQSSSLIGLDFELTESEQDEFKKEIGHSISSFLPLRLAFGPNRFSPTVSKQGPGQKGLNSKVSQIFGFVYKRVRFEYIPAIRTAGQANTLISRLIERELRAVELKAEYRRALEKIDSLERPILDALSESVTATVNNFLPSVSRISLEIKKDPHRSFRREVEISVDDGVPTNIARKGDGIQSLVALSMMRHMAQQQKGSAFSVIAIEEPESHLHPEAARELRQVIFELSLTNQVVLSSHSPLFVHIAKTSSNIIVQNKKATPAKSVHEIRNCLGVRLSDNLQNAELVLLLEGEADRVALSSILTKQSKIIEKALRDQRLAIDTTGGGSNFANKASFYLASACSVHCFADHDQAGIEGVKKAIELKYLTAADYQYAIDPGKAKSEFEDLIDETVYADRVKSDFGVDISQKVDKKAKWSDRLKKQFHAQGKRFEDVEVAVKTLVADCVARNPQVALHPQKASSVDALIASLEGKLA